MFNGRKRKLCRNALVRCGCKNPELYFERGLRNYTSYWGDGDDRFEVIMMAGKEDILVYEYVPKISLY